MHALDLLLHSFNALDLSLRTYIPILIATIIALLLCSASAPISALGTTAGIPLTFSFSFLRIKSSHTIFHASGEASQRQ